MFTASEVRYFQSFGSAVVDASVISVNKMIRTYNYLRPYGEQVRVFMMYAAAFTIAAGMIARELWEVARPIAMAKIDEIVESGYAKCSESDTELQQQPVDNTPLVSPDQPAPVALPVAAKTIAQPTLIVKRGIRELRQEAKAQGIKGFARMTLAQLAEHGIVQ